MKNSIRAIRFLESLSIPEGPKAGQAVKLTPLQKQFVKAIQRRQKHRRRSAKRRDQSWSGNDGFISAYQPR
jgi:hypothetical protein